MSCFRLRTPPPAPTPALRADLHPHGRALPQVLALEGRWAAWLVGPEMAGPAPGNPRKGGDDGVGLWGSTTPPDLVERSPQSQQLWWLHHRDKLTYNDDFILTYLITDIK